MEGLQKNQPLDPKLIQGNRKIYATFKDKIRSTCPNFVPRKRNETTVSDTSQNLCSCRICVRKRSQALAVEEPIEESDADSEDSASTAVYLDDMRSHITKLVMQSAWLLARLTHPLL